MNQEKIGNLLKCLRKEKGLTQEQLAEQFYVSSRTVSRWETGNNLPDICTLIELADFYDIDVRELIDGERKRENMDNKTKETFIKIAEYATEGERRTQSKVIYIALITSIVLFVCTILFANETGGLLYGIVPEEICNIILTIVYVSATGLLFAYIRVRGWLETPSKEQEKSVTATVVSKKVIRGTHGAGRSIGGYSFVVNFMTEDNQALELFTYEIEFGSLKEGMHGILTYQGRYFVCFEYKDTATDSETTLLS